MDDLNNRLIDLIEPQSSSPRIAGFGQPAENVDATGRIITTADTQENTSATTPKVQSKNCSAQEIAMVNAQGAYKVAKDNLSKAQIELKMMRKNLIELKQTQRKEKNNISGDKGKAKQIGAAVGAFVGGAISLHPYGKATSVGRILTGVGRGMSTGAFSSVATEEIADTITTENSDLQIYLKISALKNNITQKNKLIETRLKKELSDKKHLLNKKRNDYANCKRA